jgi:3-oxoacyl-[acyl-carrier protein] reductase
LEKKEHDMAERSPKRIALVTGGSRGIGLGIAKKLASEGYGVAINGRRPESDVQDALDAINAAGKDAGGEAMYCRCDIAELDDHAAMLDEIKSRFGRLDVLVNNAGVAPNERADILEASPESFDRLMTINTRGPYFLTQAVAKWMIQQKKADDAFAGVIVNVTSISATVISINRGDYCLSKAASAMGSALWAVRLADEGIRVYEVRPGIIKTDMTSGVTDKYDKLLSDGLAVERRWGTPEDVASAVAPLARAEMSYASGSVIMVDGGITLPRL